MILPKCIGAYQPTIAEPEPPRQERPAEFRNAALPFCSALAIAAGALEASETPWQGARGPGGSHYPGTMQGVSCFGLPCLAILISYERHALHATLEGAAPCL